jgi:hypothetical protein
MIMYHLYKNKIYILFIFFYQLAIKYNTIRLIIANSLGTFTTRKKNGTYIDLIVVITSITNVADNFVLVEPFLAIFTNVKV